MQKITIPDVKKPKINQGIMLDGSLLNNSRPIIKPIEAEEKPQIKIENTIDVKDETLNEIEIPEEPQPEKIEIDGKTGWKIQCLLNHRLAVDSLLQVQSRSFNGNVKVIKGKHDSNFITEVEVVEL